MASCAIQVPLDLSLNRAHLDDAVVNPPRRHSPNVTEMESHPRKFLLIRDLLAIRGKKAWKSAFPENATVLAFDAPWNTEHVASDHAKKHYALVTDSALLEFARHSLLHAFTPTSEQPTGLAFAWYTNDKLDVATRMLQLAGYTVVGYNAWVKTKADGQPISVRSHMGNGEGFLVGIKSQLRERINATQRAMRIISGQPYDRNLHSSKPLAFYHFVEQCCETWVKEIGSDPHRVNLELFSRHCMKGWISAGNQFFGERVMLKQRTCDVCDAKVVKDDAMVVECQMDKCERVWHIGCCDNGRATCRQHDRAQKRKRRVPNTRHHPVQVGQRVYVQALNDTVLEGSVTQILDKGQVTVDFSQPGANWGARVQLEELSGRSWSIRRHRVIPTDQLVCEPRGLQRNARVLIKGESRSRMDVFWIAEYVSRSQNDTMTIRYIDSKRLDVVESAFVYSGF